jgi:tetratricopeptide (TPR) repeat protein
VLAQTLTGLAALQQAQGKFPVAEELFTRAVELFGGSSHDGPAGLARTFLSIALEGLGGVPFRQGRLDVAEQEFERSWHNEMMRSGGADPVRLAILNAELAEVLTARGRYEDAKGLYQQALRGSTKESGNRNTPGTLFKTPAHHECGWSGRRNGIPGEKNSRRSHLHDEAEVRNGASWNFTLCLCSLHARQLPPVPERR